MTLVLPCSSAAVFMTIMFCSHHADIAFMSASSFPFITGIIYPCTLTVESTAYILIFEVSRCRGKSFIYRIKNKGPIIDPWWILTVVVCLFDS